MHKQPFAMTLFALLLANSLPLTSSQIMAPMAVRMRIQEEREAKEEKAKVAQKETSAAEVKDKESALFQRAYQEFAGMKSIAAMRKVVSEHFDKNNRLNVSKNKEKKACYSVECS